MKYRQVYGIVMLTMLSATAQAQTPFINTIDKKSAYVYDTLTISGNNFGTDINDIRVTFGAVQGQVATVTDNTIKAIVPAGATFGPVAVTRLSQTFTVYSSSFFLPSYSGDTLQNSYFDTLLTLTAEEEALFDLCTCDFDGDGDIDIGTTNNADAAKSTSVTVYANQTMSPDTLAFQKVAATNLNINSAARNITCGDLNGDGKPELIVSQGGGAAEQIFIFKNTSTASPAAISFEDAIIVNVAGDGPTNGTRRLAVQDLNGDGLPEIVVTNQTVNQLHILLNESVDGNITFTPEAMLSIEVPANTLGLAITDLNQDFLPEILVANNVGDGLYLLKNSSSPGDIHFDPVQTIAIPGPLINIVTGDLDGDDRNDMVLTNLQNNSVFIVMNQSNEGKIILASPLEISVASQPWGLDLGDVDGNGKADILVATLASTDSITLLANQSALESPGFTPYKIGASLSARNIKVADLNGDAKADIVFTKEDNGGNFSLAALRNTSCIQPVITPSNPDAICESRPLTLFAPHAAYVSYQWQKDGTDIPGATQPTLTATAAGDYSLRMTSTYDGCDATSSSVTVIEDSGTIPNAPLITAPAQVCEGEDVQLTASNISGVTYEWYGPAGFTSNAQNPVISQVTPEQAGEYFLEVKQGACKSAIVSTIIEVISLPEIKIQTSGSDMICSGEAVTLSVNDPSAVSFQWNKDGNAITNANTDSLEVSSPGTYSVSVETNRGCYQESKPFTIQSVNIQADFEPIDPVCAGENVAFMNQSVVDSSRQVTYFWDFGDGNTSSLENPTHTFQTGGIFPVTLKAYYNDTTCNSEIVQEVEVIALPQVTVLPGEDIRMCPGDTLAIRLDGIFSSLTWQDGSTDSTLLVTQSGIYIVAAYNALGCYEVSTIKVTEHRLPPLEISVEKDNHISLGESVILTATGADTYEWSPAESLDDPKSANPVATPAKTTTYTVTGYYANGCKSTAKVTVYVALDKIDVRAHALFSPNYDGIDDYWILENIASYPDCYFKVFNMQGKLVYQSSTGYNNDWDGTDNSGYPLKEGVYYYVIRCGSKENKQSGSITLIR